MKKIKIFLYLLRKIVFGRIVCRLGFLRVLKMDNKMRQIMIVFIQRYMEFITDDEICRKINLPIVNYDEMIKNNKISSRFNTLAILISNNDNHGVKNFIDSLEFSDLFRFINCMKFIKIFTIKIKFIRKNKELHEKLAVISGKSYEKQINQLYEELEKSFLPLHIEIPKDFLE